MKFRKLIVGFAAACGLGALSAQADPIELNGHWYDYVGGVMTWEEALAAAAASSYMGMDGYLATITSQEENDLLYALLVENGGSGGWLGGSDADAEGTWRWVTGLEAGQVFGYTNWDGGEPNDCCNGEDYLQMTTRQAGGWNDLDNGGTYLLTGYFVEYSKVPEPGTLALLGLGLAGLGFARRRKV